MRRPTDQLPPWVVMLRWLAVHRWWCVAGLAALYAAGFNGQWRIRADGSLHLLLAEVFMGRRTPPLAIDLTQISPGLAWLTIGLGGRPSIATALAMLVFSGFATLLAYLIFARCRSRGTAVFLTMLLALNAMWHGVAYEFLTELPFTVGLMLLLYGHERRLAGESVSGWALIAVGFVVMACFRSVVLVVLAAYVLSEAISVLRKPKKNRALLGVILAAATCGAVALCLMLPAVRADIGHLLHALSQIEMLTVCEKLVYLADEALFSAVFGQDVSGLLAVPVGLLLIGVGLSLVRVRLFWGVLMLAFCAQWLVFIPVERYVLPLMPVLVLGYWELLIGIARRFKEPFRGWTMGAGLVLMVGPNVVSIGLLIAEQRATPFLKHYDHGKYVSVIEQAAWLNQNTGPDDLMVANPETASELAYFSGRGVMTYVQEEAFDCPDLWVGTPMLGRIEGAIGSVNWTLEDPAFTTVDQMSGQAVSIHRVARTPVASDKAPRE